MFRFPSRSNLILAALFLAAGASAQDVPSQLQPPAGHAPFLRTQASGTQNYVCLPSPVALAWKFQGPQATVFVTFKWMNTDVRQQVMTHYLSPNPREHGTARPAWQSSTDTSAIWAKKIAESSDPAYVAPGAIPWLLLEVTGTQRGPMNGALLTQTTYLQRIQTSGGSAPNTPCTEAGALAFVPYTTEYIFFRKSN